MREALYVVIGFLNNIGRNLGDYITCMRLLMLFVSSGLVSLVTVPFCLLASTVVHGFRSVLLSVLLYAFSSWLLIGASFGLQMASYYGRIVRYVIPIDRYA